MKISKNFEQGIYVLLILATQKGQKPVKSQTLSRKLEVSDSSLKKILRKLVVANLITSNASKDGGFQLNVSIECITLYDVLQAVSESEIISYDLSHLSRRIFFNEEHIAESENKVINQLEKASRAFEDTLKYLSLRSLLENDYYENRLVEWNEEQ